MGERMMQTVGYPIDIPEVSERIYRCVACGWYRYLSVKQSVKESFILHGVYGVVTVEKAAKKDVETHNCEQHLASVRRAKMWRSR